MLENLKLLILAKTIDSGTGTFILKFLKINRFIGNNFQIKIFASEKFNFLKVNKRGFVLLSKKIYPLPPNKWGRFTPVNFVKGFYFYSHTLHFLPFYPIIFIYIIFNLCP